MLNENPEITFFRKVFLRYTTFSKEFIVEPVSGNQGTPDYVVTLSKAGDLVHRVFLRVKLIPKKTVPPEPPSNSWSLNPTVLQTFQNTLPLSPSSSLLTIYETVIRILGIKKLLLGDISETETFTEVEKVEDLILWFGNTLAYRAFLFLDFTSVVSTIQTEYANGGTTISSDVMSLYTEHPIHRILFLDNNASYVYKNKLPPFDKDYVPYLFESYFLEIGGNIISQYTPQYYTAVTTLKESFNTPEYSNMASITETAQGDVYVHLPLLFFFCDTTVVSLPICAMRYHDVRIGVRSTTLPFISQLWEVESIAFMVEYIHLSDRERLKFMTSKHEYLIQQIQEQPIDIPRGMTDVTSELVFTRPSIELLWTPVLYKDKSGLFVPHHFDIQIIPTCELLLGGDSIGTEKDGKFYRLIPPYEAHSSLPDKRDIYSFSFALDAEGYQPSGSLNLGRIPHCFLRFSVNPEVWKKNPHHMTLYVFNRCYNVLRIANGFTDLAFS